MDVYEATRIVLSRIKSLDPENATKIMGLLLLQDHGDKEMIRLAFGPEALIHSLVLNAHKELGLGHHASPSSWPPPQSLFSRSNSSNSVLTRSLNELSSCDELNSPMGCGDLFLNSDEMSGFEVEHADEFGWRPCLYFARGHCKNGTACRFVHGLSDEAANTVEHELLLRSRSPRVGASQLIASAFPYSPRGSLPLSPSTQSKCLSFLLQQQQQQHESQRIAELMARARLDRGDMNPAARQIYLTFPADSTFREEDVSNYFSIYGPVQDVRIPYQQKRMFGFVTFVYAETVKLILAKGNPHFVCDARVLVKPYKEKGKVYEKRQQQGERMDFAGSTTPTGLGIDSRGDAYEFQQLGAKMMYNTNSSQELLLRRKLEEQQQAAELQQAIELQQRRFMGLNLLGLKSRSAATAPVPINTIIPIISTIDSSSSSSNSSLESSSPEDKSPDGVAAMDKKVNSGHGILQETAVSAADKQESNGEADPKGDGDYQESYVHNLPDSPFASPKISMTLHNHFFANEAEVAVPNGGATQSFYGNSSFGHKMIASTVLPTTSNLDGAPLKSCYFQMPRFSDNGAIGM